MNRIKAFMTTLVLSAVFLAGIAKTGSAALSDNVDIHVSIAGTKEVVIVGTTYYDFGAMAVKTSSVSASSITVQNNSTVFVETYTITGANAISSVGGTDWSLQSSTGTNQYALGAQFSDARPADTNAAWTNDDLDTGATTCSATTLGNGTESEGGSNVSPSENRALWFRMRTPEFVSDGTQHNITVTVTVL